MGKIRFGGSSSRGSTSGGETSVSELQQYLNAMTVEPDDDFNILAWWKSYESRFFVLSTMACDILTYLVSTVASEFAFSTGRRVLDEYRSRLDPTTVEALVCM